MGHLGKPLILGTPLEDFFSFMFQLIYPLIENPLIHFFMLLFVPTASKNVVAMMQSLFFLLCSSGLCVTNWGVSPQD